MPVKLPWNFDEITAATAREIIELDQVSNHAQLKRASGDVGSFDEKVIPVDADLILIEDSEAAGAKKKVQIGNLPGGTGGAAWGGITGTLADQTDLNSALSGKAPSSSGVTNGDSHDHAGGDGAQIDHGGLAGLGDDDHSHYHTDARGDARYSLINPRSGPISFWTDMHDANMRGNAPWLGNAISSGTIAVKSGLVSADHPGVLALKSAAGNNSGYSMLLGQPSNPNYHENTVIEMVAYVQNPAAGTTIWYFGLHNSTSAARPTNGVWLEFSSALGTILGYTNNNNTGYTPTGTSYTYTPDGWIRVEIAVDAAGTSAVLTVYNMAGAVLWTQSLALTLPTRTLAPMLIVINTAPVSARELLTVDWICFTIYRDIARG